MPTGPDDKGEPKNEDFPTLISRSDHVFTTKVIPIYSMIVSDFNEAFRTLNQGSTISQPVYARAKGFGAGCERTRQVNHELIDDDPTEK